MWELYSFAPMCRLVLKSLVVSLAAAGLGLARGESRDDYVGGGWARVRAEVGRSRVVEGGVWVN